MTEDQVRQQPDWKQENGPKHGLAKRIINNNDKNTFLQHLFPMVQRRFTDHKLKLPYAI